ncbi:uncharacterized protein LOC126966142 isoform X2 [Leptidea sinapis]|uniref:uncharacterized protein LOC126966142 isoform X2 n=1 Tax=Leptidea sinapis TaxID=189913 RepID=UPI0021C3270C|nr:uncharacterized protein LOC126966142 isoform X2 [Leptidea sinapis]
MFYPAKSLRPGGRFHICWVADTYPACFEKISPEQIISQDVPRLCEELLKIINQDTGRRKYYSLRLCSQLMRGLAKINQRKASILLDELWAIKRNIRVPDIRHIELRAGRLNLPILDIDEMQESTLEEIMQSTSNSSAHIEDITLQEPTLPESHVWHIDFSELAPNEAMQFLTDDPLEVMLARETGVAAPSADMTTALDISAGARKSRGDVYDEEIPEFDFSMLTISTDDNLHPSLHLHEETPSRQPEIPQNIVVETDTTMTKKDRTEEDMTLEPIDADELKAERSAKKRKRKTVDKKITLSTSEMIARINNTYAYQRPMNTRNDPKAVKFAGAAMFQRPAHPHRPGSSLPQSLARIFLRNIAARQAVPQPDDHWEEALDSYLEGVSQLTLTPGDNVSVREETLPTLIVDRTTEEASIEKIPSPVKRSRHSGVLFRKAVRNVSMELDEIEISKENIANNEQITRSRLASMLGDVGKDDLSERGPVELRAELQSGIRQHSECSETPLGSLDRTLVSLGVSETTTDSKRFIRNEWGIEGTMHKIWRLLSYGRVQSISFEQLLNDAVVPGHSRLIATECFMSILKLRQHGFVKVTVVPGTNEIKDIYLGPLMQKHI